MELTSFVFPSHKSSYSYSDFPNNLLFVPRARIFNGRSMFDEHITYDEKEAKHIPCLYITNDNGSSKLLIYFHANVEDLGQACSLMERFVTSLGVHILAVEYPNYGIYPGTPSEHHLLNDAINVYDYITTKIGWKPEDIIIAGRSIGSGPAIYLASHRMPGALLLISAYTSVKDAAKNIAGNVLTSLVKDRFKNKEHISNVKCPVFLVHGQKDNIVPFSHTQELLSRCQGPCLLNLPENTDHENIDFENDVINPFKDFLKKFWIKTTPVVEAQEPNLPEEVFLLPKNYPKVSEPGMVKKLILKLM